LTGQRYSTTELYQITTLRCTFAPNPATNTYYMKNILLLLAIVFLPTIVFAQTATNVIAEKKQEPYICNTGGQPRPQEKILPKKHGFYISWGYNTESYTQSDLHISQPSLNNDYTFQDFKAHDHKGWDDQIFQQQLSIPQYNYRIGYYLNKQKGLSIEINFDHTKYVATEPQNAHVVGTLNGKSVDTIITFDHAHGFFYYLNNGANFFLLNIVKQWSLYNSEKYHTQIHFLGKAGIGPVVPHVENAFFGRKNDPHFQIGGWNTGIEACIKATFHKYVYLEFSNKLDYARYSDLKIYEGTAKQAFGTYEVILSLGVNIPNRKN